MFGTTSSGALNRERLQPQPQLSSSSSAAAEEFPARVLQQIVSHHLRCLGKYPSTVGGNTHRLCVGPLSLSLSLSFPLSVSYLLLVLLFFFSLSQVRENEAPLYRIYSKFLCELVFFYFSVADDLKMLALLFILTNNQYQHSFGSNVLAPKFPPLPPKKNVNLAAKSSITRSTCCLAAQSTRGSLFFPSKQTPTVHGFIFFSCIHSQASRVLLSCV